MLPIVKAYNATVEWAFCMDEAFYITSLFMGQGLSYRELPRWVRLRWWVWRWMHPIDQIQVRLLYRRIKQAEAKLFTKE